MNLLRTWRGRLAALALFVLAPAIVFSDVVPEPPVALLRALLDAGTPNRVVVNNGSGVMTDAAAITPSRVLLSDANGIPTAHGGLTADRLLSSGPSGLMSVLPAITPSRALLSDANGFPVAASNVDSTELGYLDGLAGPIGAVWLASYSPSAAASVDVTTVITNTYARYLFVWDLVPVADANTLLARTDFDGGASFDLAASDYAYHRTNASGTSTVNATGSDGQTSIQLGSNIGIASTSTISGSMLLTHRGSASRWPHLTWQASLYDPFGQHVATSGAGSRRAVGTVNALQFRFNSGNISSGSVHAYGLLN